MCPHPYPVTGVVSQPCFAQMRMLANAPVDPFPQIGSMQAGRQHSFYLQQNVGDMPIDLMLQRGDCFNREGPAEIGPVPVDMGPGINDVELVSLNLPVAGKPTRNTCLVITAVNDLFASP